LLENRAKDGILGLSRVSKPFGLTTWVSDTS
jgi:hypothetical protein